MARVNSGAFSPSPVNQSLPGALRARMPGKSPYLAPPGKKFGTFIRPSVRFGRPLDFSRYEGLENDRYILRAITDEIMYELMQLSGQEYVDQYAAKVKAAEGKDTGFGSRDRESVRELGDRLPGTRAS